MIKARINQHGDLILLRGKNLKAQACIYTPEYFCGDGCPLFHEPSVNPTVKPKGVRLDICRRTFYFSRDEFEDLRGTK